jgi:hypothetical protein
MFQGVFDRGFASTQPQVERLTRPLGHAPGSNEAFAKETVAEWLRNEKR